MIANRILQVKVVKAQSALPPVKPEDAVPVEERVVWAVRESSKYIGSAIVAYVAADTIRQIAFYAAVQKLGS